MRKNSKLNVFGDSYATPELCVDVNNSFWGKLAKDLGVGSVDNYSHPGFSLDHIIHLLLNEEFDFAEDYFVIGIPPLIRYMAYSDNVPKPWYKKTYSSLDAQPEEMLIESLSNTQKFTFEEQFANDKKAITKFNSEWNDVQCLEKIYLLHQYLTLKQAKFIIVNLSVPVHYQDLWPAGKNIMIKVNQLPECIIFDNTYYSVNYNDGIKPADFDQYSWMGHHGPEGNINWYNKKIRPKIKELGWIDA